MSEVKKRCKKLEEEKECLQRLIEELEQSVSSSFQNGI